MGKREPSVSVHSGEDVELCEDCRLRLNDSCFPSGIKGQKKHSLENLVGVLFPMKSSLVPFSCLSSVDRTIPNPRHELDVIRLSSHKVPSLLKKYDKKLISQIVRRMRFPDCRKEMLSFFLRENIGSSAATPRQRWPSIVSAAQIPFCRC